MKSIEYWPLIGIDTLNSLRYDINSSPVLIKFDEYYSLRSAVSIRCFGAMGNAVGFFSKFHSSLFHSIGYVGY
jgi:hypothetical protein